MSTYSRVERADHLPPAGPVDYRSREKVDVDFKRFADKAKMKEHAKDIAAFANTVGGVLIIGADNETDPDRLVYPGVQGQLAAEVRTIYEHAAKLCSPSLVVDVVPVPLPGLQVVAVNVDPYVDQLVGAPGEGDSWRFPIRRASQTAFVTPENLPMYMHRQLRRSYLLLASIPLDRRGDVIVFYPKVAHAVTGRLDTLQGQFILEDVPRDRNHIVLRDGNRQCRVPLADVIDVWEQAAGSWAIKVGGTINKVGTRDGEPMPITYSPLF